MRDTSWPKVGAPGRSAPQLVTSTPVSTTSATPARASACTRATTSPAGTEREGPRP